MKQYKSGRSSDCNEKAIRGPLSKMHEKVLRNLQRLWGFQIGMVNCYDVWVPHILTEKHLLTRVTACISLLSRHNEHSFLNRIVTWDQKWISYNNVVWERSWSLQSEPFQTVKKVTLYPKKDMLYIWWDCRGPIYYELLPMKYCAELEFWRPQLKKNTLV